MRLFYPSKSIREPQAREHFPTHIATFLIAAYARITGARALFCLKNRRSARKQRLQNFGMPFMPPIFFIIFIMPLPFIFFIMPCICSNSLSKRLTS